MESMDSIYAMNGKSVEVDNTDAEGRLILSGAYSMSFLMWQMISLMFNRRVVLCIDYLQATHIA
jgi:hypothetical protein